jgi:hypothetical protein
VTNLDYRNFSLHYIE